MKLKPRCPQVSDGTDGSLQYLDTIFRDKIASKFIISVKDAVHEWQENVGIQDCLDLSFIGLDLKT